jgi:tyrosinase
MLMLASIQCRELHLITSSAIIAMNVKTLKELPISFSLVTALLSCLAFGQDLYMEDITGDGGLEPNAATVMWNSPDIWVRKNGDPNWQPHPFATGSPPWSLPSHQNPEFRDPALSAPNYVYVRISNRGTAPSTGTERVRLYWAKASTGLGWPDQWTGDPATDNGDTYIDTFCGTDLVAGREITKPRINAADATTGDIARYVAAVQNIDATTHPGSGDTMFNLQDIIHATAHAEHRTDAFLPWHRELVNRYEQMLLSVEPRLTMLYWNWEDDPRAPFNYYTSSFMGASSGSVGAPFASFSPSISRNFSSFHLGIISPDSTHYPFSDFVDFSDSLEGQSHDWSHGVIGATMGSPATSTRDPFFFLLHTNCDRIWAKWQGEPGHTDRIDPVTAYGSSTSATLSGDIGPWDGSSPTIAPWTSTGGYLYGKAYDDASLGANSYDNGGVPVPMLNPGESCIVQVAWYPPNPADFSACFSDAGHCCLLARIETSTAAPYGMNIAEGNNLPVNVLNNNNIAWKNLTVVDDFSGLGLAGVTGGLVIRNVDRVRDVLTTITFTVPGGDNEIPDELEYVMEMPPEIFARWVEAGGQGQGIERLRGNAFRITGSNAAIGGIVLAPKENFIITPRFKALKRLTTAKNFFWHVKQFGTPENAGQLVGGNSYRINFNRIRLVKPGAQWCFLDKGGPAPEGWHKPEFDDAGWKKGSGELGRGDSPATLVDIASDNVNTDNVNTIIYNTAYFRRNFYSGDPDLYESLHMACKADDGVIVYLNGTVILRRNMPDGQVDYETAALEPVVGVDEEVFFSSDISGFKNLLQPGGGNVIAAEVHQARSSNDPIFFEHGIDLSFDLALFANAVDEGGKPPVVVLTGLDDRVYDADEQLEIGVDAIGSSEKDAAFLPWHRGYILKTILSVDGEQVGQADDFSLQVNLANILANRDKDSSIVRLVASATDQQGRTSSVTRAIRVVDNKPPTVSIEITNDRYCFQLLGEEFSPQNPSSYTWMSKNLPSVVKEGNAIGITVSAEDVGGEIAAVRFRYKSCDTPFSLDPVLIAEFTEAPYTIEISNLHRGTHNVYVEVEDNEGAVTTERVKFMGALIPELDAQQLDDGRVEFSWEGDLESIKFQRSTDLRTWSDVPDAQNPYQTQVAAVGTYYRLTYDLLEATRPESAGQLGITNELGMVCMAYNHARFVIEDPVSASSFTLASGSGENVSLDNFAGDNPSPVVLLFYSGQQCPMCLEQLSAFNVAYEQFKAAGIEVVAISPDSSASLARVQKNYQFPLLSDTDGSVSRSYGIVDENGDASHGVAVVDQRGELFWLAVTDLPFMSVGDVYAVAFNRYVQPKE